MDEVEVPLGHSFGDVAVKVNGATIEVRGDGSVQAYTDHPVKLHIAANDASSSPGDAPDPKLRGRTGAATLSSPIGWDIWGPETFTPR